MTNNRKKLIEVALPLEAINAASAREKSIRHGHPSTLHLWWARRPLAAARAVIFAQMVDDPSAYVDELKSDGVLRRAAETVLKGRLKSWKEAVATAETAKAAGIAAPEPGPEPKLDEILAERERARLFKIIEDLVQWENTTNEAVLDKARVEIWQSWRRACALNAGHPRAKELFDRNKLPAFHDPFAGGGALPLEAQRLGLEAYASDLNPVAVLINKAMIEIPPKFAGRPPVNPQAREGQLGTKTWKGAQGLAEDVRYYGKWMRDEAEKRIGHLYPKIEVTAEIAEERPDLKPYTGQKLTVIAWLWARTVKSPNPAFAHVDVPLASTFMLSTKAGKEAYVLPVIEKNGYRFTVKTGTPTEAAKSGTKLSRGANFKCLMSDVPIESDYVKSEGRAGRMGARLMAVVAEGDRGRVYLAPTPEHEAMALTAKPTWNPEAPLPEDPRNFWTIQYGLTTYGDLFTPRQLVALTTFSDLVAEAREKVCADAEKFQSFETGPSAAPNPWKITDARALRDGGAGALAYADAVSSALSLSVDKAADYWSSICFWHNGAAHQKIVNTFGRQAIPMSWDFAEGNPFSASSGHFLRFVSLIGEVYDCAASGFAHGCVVQQDASTSRLALARVVSTDPPYYDNIGYADLSDFFYVWLRRSVRSLFPDLFATLAVPKAEELVATPYRHGGKESAETFFLGGMTQAMSRLAEQAHPGFPVTIYYAFKQAESDSVSGIASTGWETFLDAVLRAGFSVGGTWPMRTEYTGNLKKNVSALASSIVLVCRKRAADAGATTRREFVAELKRELPVALRHLQEGNIAPVDLAQAAIGPGMAVYTRFAQVLDAEGKALSVRGALALINQTLDEALADQEGDFDPDSRWALAWFEQNGFGEGEYGVAEVLSKAKATAVNGLVEAGIIAAGRGKVRLLKPEEMPADWDPRSDARLTAWETVHHLVRVLEAKGEAAAAKLVSQLGTKAETARELCYRLYTVCERKKRAAEALSYNGLVQSWPELVRLAQESPAPARPQQGELL